MSKERVLRYSYDKAQKVLDDKLKELKETGINLLSIKETKQELAELGLEIEYRTYPQPFLGLAKATLYPNPKKYIIVCVEDWTFPMELREHHTLQERFIIAHEIAHFAHILYREGAGYTTHRYIYPSIFTDKKIEDMCDNFAASLLGVGRAEVRELIDSHKKAIQTRFL